MLGGWAHVSMEAEESREQPCAKLELSSLSECQGLRAWGMREDQGA